jgi:hypothetical protein
MYTYKRVGSKVIPTLSRILPQIQKSVQCLYKTIIEHLQSKHFNKQWIPVLGFRLQLLVFIANY